MAIREKLDPSATLYTAQEIAEDLDIPIAVIERLRRAGILTPSTTGGDHYPLKSVQFLEQYWMAFSDKLRHSINGTAT